jgi:NADH:ubiquinone oxidoreductase subunit 4 (subunit M)
VAGTSVIWSSIYSLLLFTKVAFGNYKPFGKFNVFFKDLVFFEFLVFALLATLSLVLGLNPNLCLDFMNFSTIFLIEYSKARF